MALGSVQIWIENVQFVDYNVADSNVFSKGDSMEKGKNILDRITESKTFLPRKQQSLCNYILENRLMVGTLTVAELAARANVAATTVLRLTERLGYSCYSDFKKDLFEAALQQQDEIYAPMKSSFSVSSDDNALTILCNDIEKECPKIAQVDNQKQFDLAVKAILAANHIYVLGLRSAAAIATYFENSIHLFMKETFLLSQQQEYLFDRVLEITPKDILFLISTWPCTKKTVDFARLCYNRHVPIILVTNSNLNPIAQYSDYTISTDTVNKSGYHISSLIVCQAFIDELGRRNYPRSGQKLTELEEFFKENNIVTWAES